MTAPDVPPNSKLFSLPDFRLFWFGALISAMGTWVQSVAQGYFVYELTRSESKLAIISFVSSIPVAVLGLFVGAFIDRLDKRRTLIIAQALFALVALTLAWATWRGVASYGALLAAAFINGLVSTFEVSTRQSVTSRVVPRSMLAQAVPITAMTFNLARIVGPAVAGVILATLGVPACYLINGLSFLALIATVIMIRADLRALPEASEGTPVQLFKEGWNYVAQHIRMRTLILMELVTACFGVFYVTQIPSFVQETLGFSSEAAKSMNGQMYTAVGVGALAGLLFASRIATDSGRRRLVAAAMFALALGLTALSLARTPWMAFPWMALCGACTVVQFNTTNSLVQTGSPEILRGRTLSIHIWAINGMSPLGGLIMGFLADAQGHSEGGGVPWALRFGAVLILAGAIWGLIVLRRAWRQEQAGLTVEPSVTET